MPGMIARPHRSSRWTRAAFTAVALVALAAHLVSGSALGGLQARLDNTNNSASSATLLYTHSYGSNSCTSVPGGAVTDSIQSVSCPGSAYPTSSAGSRADAITANGTVPASAVTQTASIASCGIVSTANRMSTARPLLPRNGTSFATAGGPMGGTGGFITLDGAAPGGYESAAVQQSQPNPGLSLGSTYGLGIWFRTSSTTGGPLFGFGDSPVNVAGTNDRVLFMTAGGQLNFKLNSGAATTGNSTGSFNNGAWHFAYVTLLGHPRADQLGERLCRRRPGDQWRRLARRAQFLQRVLAPGLVAGCERQSRRVLHRIAVELRRAQ